jgi:hypothetical protein
MSFAGRRNILSARAFKYVFRSLCFFGTVGVIPISNLIVGKLALSGSIGLRSEFLRVGLTMRSAV